MTATFDTMTDIAQDGFAPASMPRVDVVRIALQVVGSVLVLAAIAVLLQPSAQTGSDVLVMQLGVSMFLSLAGFVIMHERPAEKSPVVEIDTVRREVRVVKYQRRTKTVVDRTSMRDLGQAETQDDVIRITTADGNVLAEVALSDPKVRSSLSNALKDAGKL